MDHHLLDKYLNGECNQEEKAAVNRWLEDNSPLPHTALTEKDKLIQEKVSVIINRQITSPVRTPVPLFKYLSVAAVALLVSSVAVFWYTSQHSYKPEKAIKWTTSEIPDGQKATIKLADGSTIELNGGSSIAYPDRFTSERVVKLIKGDAFFMISKDPDHPFIVQTDASSSIRVLGTRFNVKNNHFTSNLEITLNSGQINFERKGYPAQVLKPGEQLNYALHTHAITAPFSVDTLASIAWRKNILLFKDTPIQQVLREIEQAYGVKFIYNGSVKEQLMNAEFTAEPLYRVLSMISKTSKLKFKQQEKRIYVNP